MIKISRQICESFELNFQLKAEILFHKIAVLKFGPKLYSKNPKFQTRNLKSQICRQIQCKVNQSSIVFPSNLQKPKKKFIGGFLIIHFPFHCFRKVENSAKKKQKKKKKIFWEINYRKNEIFLLLS